MSAADQPYVFVSYASADRARVLEVADALERAGIAVWLDRRSIGGGASWSAEIVAGVKGCAALVLLVSPAAMQSPNVGQEVQLAWEARRSILPLLLAPADPLPAIEYALAGRQRVELLDRPVEEWRPDLLRAIAGLGLVPATPAAPAPAEPGQRVRLAPAVPPTNLPRQLTSFVGRETALADVAALLASAALVTLTGVGGTGKTRLALAVAERGLAGYSDGAWLVELAPSADASLVPQAVAAALGIREQPGEPLTMTLIRSLGERHLLLVLDNCEHLIDACARLAEDLLRHCSRLTILATSREQLGVPGEVPYRVPSLALPAADADPTTLGEAEAVRLFAERALVAQPRFALTAENAATVAQLCVRLDGIPLALELAAARLRALPLEQLAARLDDRFRLLTGGSRTALPRQQTLQATLDWSYRLLDEDEKALLRRLSVFAGGWALEAAEAVCAGDGLEAWQVLDLLARLVDKSLVVPDDADGGRYRLLETVRQYALDRLLEAGEAAACRERHAAWARALAAALAPEVLAGETIAALARLDAERDNLRLALAWCAERDPRTGLVLAGDLARYWRYRGLHSEGRRWLADLRARAPADPPGRALLGLGLLALDQGDHAVAAPALTAGRACLRAEGDRAGEATALLNLGVVHFIAGDLAAGRRELEGALTLSEAAGDTRGRGAALMLLGYLHGERGDYALARATLAEAIAALRRAGDHWNQALAHAYLGETLLWAGEWAAARATLDTAGALFEALGDPGSRSWVRLLLGDLAARSGDAAAAAPLLERAASELGDLEGHWERGTALALSGQLRWRQGDRAGAAGRWREGLRYAAGAGLRTSALRAIAMVAIAAAGAGEAAAGTRLLAAIERHCRDLDLALATVARPEHAATLGAARAALGDAAFAAVRAAGSVLPLEGAVAEALALLDRLVGPEEAAP